MDENSSLLEFDDSGKRVVRCSANATAVVVPDGVRKIGVIAFRGCTSLTSIVIPDSVVDVWVWSFEDCPQLREIKVGDNNLYYRSMDGVLYSKDGTTLISYPSGKPETVFRIPDGVTTIGECAFDGCTSLSSIVIPSSVTHIKEGAFCQCGALAEIAIPSGVTKIEANVFLDCEALTSFVIPENVTEIGGAAFMYCESLKELHICHVHPEDILIADDAFDGIEECTLYVPSGSEEEYRKDERFCKFIEVVGE